ncbi:1-phosphofructokinase [Leifsonia xyli subsp. xyli]|uniref:1-phosphofructokinase n=2 Tax=Leifsonia xyli subsp. xyli TaxID=59736 RepID=Q6AG92_LEIXX|nr:1-phosphofructokinase [Leifsonia xyli]AAT88603.1 1-phosphofructokinase [Leifsonia xyli subsp. xyli str. CTCB07]ODA90568.1 1-phosphofructokinase [Leifsonia xyli subsp. xyli]
MIVTLTANPSLDRAVALAGPLRPGEVQFAASSREDAGGKGITVARVIAAAGVSTLAVLPLAGDDPFGAVLRSSAVPTRPVAIHGHARANLTITDPAGATTKLNLPGATLRAEEAETLGEAVVDACAGASWLVLAGSLPPGVGDDFYVTVIRAVRERWGEAAPRVAVDTAGEALRTVVADARPDLIKPNDDELAELSGAALDPGDVERSVLRVARTLVPGRVGAALITLGSRGSILVTPSGGYVAAAPRIRVQSTVGAGDSALAGYLLADVAGASAPQRLAGAIRYGSAAAALPGTQAPHPADLPRDDIRVAALQP